MNPELCATAEETTQPDIKVTVEPVNKPQPERKPRPLIAWEHALINFRHKKVTIKYALGPQIAEIEGVIDCVHTQGGHVIVKTKAGKVFIRYPLEIWRTNKAEPETTEGVTE